MGTLHGDVLTFMSKSHRILLIMRIFSNRNCIENKNTYFTLSNFSENRAVYEIKSKNMVEPERPQ